MIVMLSVHSNDFTKILIWPKPANWNRAKKKRKEKKKPSTQKSSQKWAIHNKILHL